MSDHLGTGTAAATISVPSGGPEHRDRQCGSHMDPDDLLRGAQAIRRFLGDVRPLRTIQWWCKQGKLPVELDETGVYVMRKSRYPRFLEELRESADFIARGIPKA